MPRGQWLPCRYDKCDMSLRQENFDRALDQEWTSNFDKRFQDPLFKHDLKRKDSFKIQNWLVDLLQKRRSCSGSPNQVPAAKLVKCTGPSANPNVSIGSDLLHQE
eukprot:scaffold9004_cov107-Cylindrotheca_fusiformis.AAC.3